MIIIKIDIIIRYYNYSIGNIEFNCQILRLADIIVMSSGVNGQIFVPLEQVKGYVTFKSNCTK